MTLGAKINRALARALMLQQGGVIDPSRGYGPTPRGQQRPTPPPGTFAPWSEQPLAAQYAERFRRLLLALERDLDAIERGSQPGDRKREEDRAVLQEKGDPTFVAFIYGRTTEAVRKLRQRRGLDPDTGERMKRDLLTSRRLPDSATTPKEAP